MYIYKTTNLINGKFYVGKHAGKTKNYKGSGTLLKRALKKHGIENFVTEILEYCTSVEELNQREIFWIEELNSRNSSIGYNVASGGEGGDTLSQHPNRFEILEKMRKSMIGKNTGSRDESVCLKMSQNRKGISSKRTKKYRLSEETKNKMSIRFSGDGNPMFGRKHTDETLQILREKRKSLPAPNKGKFKPYYFFENSILVITVYGQNSAIQYCKEQKIPYSIIVKKFLKWNNWECKTSL